MMVKLENGKCYKIDIDNLVGYCISSQDMKTTQKDVSEFYNQSESGFQISQKHINETKVYNTTAISADDNIKYETIKTMIDILYSIGIKPNENGDLSKHKSLNHISIIESVAWNTLISLRILVEV